MDKFLRMITEQEFMFDWCQNLTVRSKIDLGLL